MSGGVGADRKRGRKATAPARYPIPGGIRRIGGASPVQAPTWNVGSCDPDTANGKADG